MSGPPDPDATLPSRIILVRHGESQGNRDWRVMATVPDHLLELTERGRRDAFEAGRRLRGMVEDGERVRFYVSPYVRTRQTLEEILRSFGGTPEQATDAGGQGEAVVPAATGGGVEWDVRVEPRLREQDWGNFQNFAEMQKIKAERVAYGPFYYRIPHGESGADVYDRVSIFLESLYRSQARAWPRHPTTLIIVTHGLLARLFSLRFMRLDVTEFDNWRNLRNGEHILIERCAAGEGIKGGNKIYRFAVPPPPRDDVKLASDEARREEARKLGEAREAAAEEMAREAAVWAAAAAAEGANVRLLADLGSDPDGP
ncbi:2,3-bisphosphoglycerate-dependent phosphoglycerate mutase [Hyaloraphidium curvatum]|nr:2,3-bisphosphoglycerate-dependent phosphoglycerate mutase [Hyaloraphidium curvatum]